MAKPVLLLLMVLCAQPTIAFERPWFTGARTVPATGSIDLAFTPGERADEIVIAIVKQAKREILVQAFSFTHRKIGEALVAAKRRGVQVQLIADPDQIDRIPTTVVPKIAAGGVPVLLDREHESAHNKVMVVDAGGPECAVVTGSYNFTHAAQFKNAENLLALRGNPAVCEAYRDNWLRHARHARRYRAELK